MVACFGGGLGAGFFALVRVFRFFAVLGCGDGSFLGLEACGGRGGLVPGVLGGFSICGVDECGWFLVVLLAFGCG